MDANRTETPHYKVNIMGRTATIGYWASRGGYCVHVNGRKTTLAAGPEDGPDGPTFLAAVARLREIRGEETFGPTLRDVIADYLHWHQGQFSPRSTSTVRSRLQPVSEALGSRFASQVTAGTLETWCAEQRTIRGWGDNTVRMTLSATKAALAYALEEGKVSRLSLSKVRLPDSASRGLEVLLSPSAEERLMIACRTRLRDVLCVLRDTGARPGEVCSVEARHYDANLRAFVLPPTSRSGPTHKTGRKTRRPRVIYLRGESVAIVEALVQRYPSGPLFRSGRLARSGPNRGKTGPWSPQSLVNAIASLRRKAMVPGFVAYSFRHTFAVNRLREGWDLNALAEVMGTSVKMLRDHYLHLAEQTAYYRGLVDAIR